MHVCICLLTYIVRTFRSATPLHISKLAALYGEYLGEYGGARRGECLNTVMLVSLKSEFRDGLYPSIHINSSGAENGKVGTESEHHTAHSSSLARRPCKKPLR